MENTIKDQFKKFSDLENIGEGKITYRVGGSGKYQSVWLHIPSKISKDSSFPFTDKEKVSIEIRNDEMIVRKKNPLLDLMNVTDLEDLTLHSILEKQARKYKNKEFLIFKDKTYNFNDLYENSNKIAHGILKLINELNLKEKPKIGLMLTNCPDFIFTWFAIIKAGGIFVPINYFYKGNLLESTLNQFDVDILIIDYSYIKKIKKSWKKIPKLKKILIYNAQDDFEFDDKFIDFKKIYTDNKNALNLKYKNTDKIEILSTSGTTGLSKGVVYRNYHLITGLIVQEELKNIGVSKEDLVYCCLPLFSGFTQMLVVLPTLMFGGTLILTENLNPHQFWDDIKKFNPTIISYFGELIKILMNHQSNPNERNHNIKYAIGAEMNKELWALFENRTGIQVIEGWGLIEPFGLTLNKTGSKGGKLGSIGTPMIGFEVIIVDSEGNELPPGPDNIGEIISKCSLSQKLEYYNIEDQKVMSVDNKGWFHSNDLGYKDKDGYIYYKGRIKDMIRKEMQHLSPDVIENVANLHPFVLDSVCFGISENDELLDEDIVIVIKLKYGESMSHQDLFEYLKKNLAYFMVPRYIEFRKFLPKTALGRIKRSILKDEWNKKIDMRNIWDSQKYLEKS